VRTAAPDLDAGTVARKPIGRPERSTPWGTFAVVMVVLGGGAWWALRLNQQKGAGSTPASVGALGSLGSLTLAPGQTVHLVAVGPDVLVVGQNGSGLTTLARYSRDAFDAGAPGGEGDGALYPTSYPASAPRPASFADVLSSHGIRLPGGRA
jgi:flagellar biogenesis protein FliO